MQNLPLISFKVSELVAEKKINKQTQKLFEIEVQAGIQKQDLLY